MLSYYSTADEIESGNNGIAVLPVGSTEQHGQHLPIATDYIIAGSVAQKIAEVLGAFFLPALPISTCREHMGKKGSVWMNPDTFYAMIKDIVMCLKEQGFKKIVLVLGHGGIFIANPVVRELNATNADIKVIKVELGQFIQSPEMSSILECRNNLHACEYETSLMMFLKEDIVRKDKIIDCVPEVPRDYLNYGSIFRYSKNGVWGKPSLASKEKGEKIFEILVDKSVNYIKAVEKIIGYKP